MEFAVGYEEGEAIAACLFGLDLPVSRVHVGCYEELGLGWYFFDCVIASFDGVRECSSDLVKHAVGYAEAPSVFVPGHVFLFCFGGKDDL